MDPARIFAESLTPRPELENSLGRSRDIAPYLSARLGPRSSAPKAPYGHDGQRKRVAHMPTATTTTTEAASRFTIGPKAPTRRHDEADLLLLAFQLKNVKGYPVLNVKVVFPYIIQHCLKFLVEFFNFSRDNIAPTLLLALILPRHDSLVKGMVT